MAFVKPDFIQEAEGSWTSEATSQESPSMTVQKGDVLIALAGMEDESGLNDSLAIEGGGNTWTEAKEVKVNEYCYVRVWTTTAKENATFKVKITKTGTPSNLEYGMNVFTFRKSSGVGASAKTNVLSGAPSLEITTEKEHSAICVISLDWTAADGEGTKREWRTGAGTFTEQTYSRQVGSYTVYGGFHADAGAAGKYTVGLTKPTAEKYSIIAVEIKGEESGGKSLIQTVSDTQTFVDSIKRSAKKTRSEGIALIDTVGKTPMHAVADHAAFFDARAKKIAKRPADSVAFTDTRSASFRKARAESVVWADQLAKTFRHPASDSTAWSDSLSKAARLIKADSISFSDVVRKRASRVVTNALVFVDSVKTKLSAFPVPELPVTLTLARAARFLRLRSPEISAMLEPGSTVSRLDTRDSALDLDEKLPRSILAKDDTALDLDSEETDLSLDA